MAEIADLLNTIRTAALDPSGNRQLLATADQLETWFARQAKDLDQTHTVLAQTQQNMAKEQAEREQERRVQAEEYRILLLKFLALEEWKRTELARRFGKSSERWTADDQLQASLFNELEVSLPPPEPEEEAADPQGPATQKAKTTHTPRGKREALPDSLPRQDVYLDLPEADKCCGSCGQAMNQIGEEVSEQLQVKPTEFYVQRTHRPVFGCACGCGGIKTPAVQPQIYPKSILGDSLIAFLVVSKFCDALPFYRMERVLARSGVEVSRQTMARTAQAVAQWLQPLMILFHERLMRCKVLCADETRLRVVKENGIKKDGNSYMWVATGTDESGPVVWFHYGGGRGADEAREFLGMFEGMLMCDAYKAYDSLAHGRPIVLAACMAHVRRHFHDILKGTPKHPEASEAMEFMRRLYAVERDCAHMDDTERTAYRQEHAKPVFEAFRVWLYATAASVQPAGALGKAVAYAVKLLPRLEVYLEHGAVPIDNNRAENAIRPFVIGRKNWLCSGPFRQDSFILYYQWNTSFFLCS